jgi:hypothetical protein
MSINEAHLVLMGIPTDYKDKVNDEFYDLVLYLCVPFP